MKNILILTWFTLREALARKVFMFFIGISLLVIVGMTVVFSFIDTNLIVTGMAKSDSGQMLSSAVATLEYMIISPLSGLCILLAIFSSASFIPIMLEKGNIDLLLSKPVSRNQLIWGKYFGGVLVVFLNIAFLILGVWLIISIKFSHWDFSFLYLILIISFAFAVLYSIIVLFGILTRSSMLGMMLAYFVFLILSPLLAFANDRLIELISSKVLKDIVVGLYYFIPKTSELMGKISVALASGKAIESFQPITTSFLFLVLMMGISIWTFQKKDF